MPNLVWTVRSDYAGQPRLGVRFQDSPISALGVDLYAADQDSLSVFVMMSLLSPELVPTGTVEPTLFSLGPSGSSNFRFFPLLSPSQDNTDGIRGLPLATSIARTRLAFGDQRHQSRYGKSLARPNRFAALLQADAGLLRLVDTDGNFDTSSDIHTDPAVTTTGVITNSQLSTWNMANVHLGGSPVTNSGINAVVHEMLVYNHQASDADRLVALNYLALRWGAPLPPDEDLLYRLPGTVNEDQAVVGFGQDFAAIGCEDATVLRLTHALNPLPTRFGHIPVAESGGLKLEACRECEFAPAGQTLFSLFSGRSPGDPPGTIVSQPADRAFGCFGASSNSPPTASRDQNIGGARYLSVSHDGGANPVTFDGELVGSDIRSDKLWHVQDASNLSSSGVLGASNLGTCNPGNPLAESIVITPSPAGPTPSPSIERKLFRVDAIFHLPSIGLSFGSTPTSGYSLYASPENDRGQLSGLADTGRGGIYNGDDDTVTFIDIGAACLANRSFALRAPLGVGIVAYDEGTNGALGSPLSSGAPVIVSEGETFFLRIGLTAPQDSDTTVRLEFNSTSSPLTEIKAIGGEAVGQDFRANVVGNPDELTLESNTAVTIPAGQPHVDLRIEIYDDDFVETTREAFSIVLGAILSGATGLSIVGNPTVMVEILIDDLAAVDVSLANADLCPAGHPSADVCVVEGGGGNVVAFLPIGPITAPEEGDVIFSIVPSAGFDDLFTLSATEVRFNRFNWETPISLIISAKQDDIAYSGDFATAMIVVSLRTTGTNAELDFQNSGGGVRDISVNPDRSGSVFAYPRSITVGRSDDDQTNLVLSQTALSVSENRGQAGFTVQLGSQPRMPTDVVAVDLASSDQTAATLSLTRMLFRQSNWDMPQSTNVIGVPDDFVGDRMATITVMADNAATTDNLYDNRTATVPVTVMGVQLAALTLDTSELTVVESGIGNMARFSVALRSRPQTAVVVDVAFAPGQPTNIVTYACGSMSTRCTMTSAGNLRLSYASLEWDSALPVDVAAVDNNTRGSTATALRLSVVAASSDQWFALVSANVQVDVEDDDVPAIVVAQTSAGAPFPAGGPSISENGGTAEVWANLRVPSGSATPWQVTVDVAARGGMENLTWTPSMLLFTHLNFNVPRRIAVTAVDDALVRDDSEGLRISINDAMTTAIDYQSAPRRSVNFELVNDDFGAIVLSVSTLSLTENGDSSFTIALAASPGSGQDLVGLALDIAGESVQVADGLDLIFSGADWNEPRLATLLPNDDNFLGARTATVTVQVDPGQEGAYSSATVSQQTIPVIVISDDRPGFRFACDSCDSTVLAEGVSPLGSLPLHPATAALVQTVNMVESAAAAGSCARYEIQLTALPNAGGQVAVRFPGGVGFRYAAENQCPSVGDPRPDLLNFITVPLDAMNPTGPFLIFTVDDNEYSGPEADVYEVQPTITSAPNGLDYETVNLPQLRIAVSADDDLPRVEFAPPTPLPDTPQGFMEDDGGVYLPINLSNASRVPVAVSLGVSDAAVGAGFAERDVDYSFSVRGVDTTSTVVFFPGDTALPEAMIWRAVPEVTPVFEGDELVIVSMISVDNGRPGDPISLTLLENLPAPAFVIETTDSRYTPETQTVELAEVATGELRPEVTFSVRLDGIVPDTATVRLSVLGNGANGRPAEPEDYRLECASTSTAIVSGCVGAPVIDMNSGEASVTLSIKPGLGMSAAVRVIVVPDVESLEEEDIAVRLDPDSVIGGIFSVSDTSGAVNIRVNEDIDPPSPAVGLSASAVNGGAVRLLWEPAEDNRSLPLALSYTIHTAPGATATAAEARLPNRQLFVRGPFLRGSLEVLSGDTRVSFLVEGLLPLTKYAFVVTVVDEAGNEATYTDTAGGGGRQIVFATTTTASDTDGDGLPDHLDTVNGGAEDSDGDGLSDALELFISGVDTTQVHPADDFNRNGIPDAIEIGLGFPALSVLQGAYAWTTPEAVAAMALGGDPRHTVTVPADDLSAAVVAELSLPYTQVRVSRATSNLGDVQPESWLRRGDLCGRDVLPANYRQSCTLARTEDSLSTTDAVTFLLQSGVHRLWWMAEDARGNWPVAGAATQTIYVIPQINFSPGQRTQPQTRVRIDAYLSGSPVSEAGFTVPFLVVQDDTESEFSPTGSQGVLTFAPGALRGAVEIIPGAAMGSTITTITLALATTDRTFVGYDSAVPSPGELVSRPPRIDIVEGVRMQEHLVLPGVQSTYVLTVVGEDINLPMRFSLAVRHAGNKGLVSTVALDDVTNLIIQSTLIPPNEVSGLEYDWRGTDLVFRPEITVQPSVGPEEYSVALASKAVEPGLYLVRLEINTADTSASEQVWLNVIERIDALRAVDRDEDGLTDVEEGWSDNDMDGIPNYLDALSDSAERLPSVYRMVHIDGEEKRVPDERRAAIVAANGLSMSLGTVALSASASTPLSGYVATVTAQMLRDYGDRGREAIGAGAVADGEVAEAVGIFDFTVSGVAELGGRAELVVPLHAPLPSAPEYRSYRPSGGWMPQASGGDDRVVSLPGPADESGVCPDPDDAAWDDAPDRLTQGHRCVRLSLRDGGGNDADGRADRVVANVVGFRSAVASGIDAGSGGSGAGGGCALVGDARAADAALALLLLLCLLSRRRNAPAVALAVALTLVLLPAGARGADAGPEWGATTGSLLRNVYFGAGLASTEVAPGLFGSRYRLGSTNDSGPRLALGYRLASHWSLEAFWADLGKAEIIDTRAAAPAYADYRERGALLSYRRARPAWLGLGRGLETLGVAWGWFVSAGWSDQNAKCRGCQFANVDAGQPVLGLGIDVAAPSLWTVRLHYERYGDDASSVALSWLFGAAAAPGGGR